MNFIKLINLSDADVAIDISKITYITAVVYPDATHTKISFLQGSAVYVRSTVDQVLEAIEAVGYELR